ncbi:aminopeptidase [Thermodesulfobacteriota bacterium]
MLSKKKLERYSDVLIWALKTARKGSFVKDDIIFIRYQMDALQMAETLHAKILDLGMHPALRMGLTSRMEKNFYTKASGRQLVFHPPGQRRFHQNLNGGIYLLAPQSLTHLSDVDPRRIGKAAIAMKPYRDILNKREERGLFGWTLCMLPTPELANKAGLSIKQYEAQVIKACYLDKPDPVGAWKAIYRNAAAIKKWLNSLDIKYLHVESENIDLKITPGDKRRWVGISGHNIPSFEIFLSPDWRGTEGVYFANQPSFRSGNYVARVTLTFKKGKVVKMRAKKGEDFTKKQISMDPGAKRVGEFSLTDKRFSRINRFMANTLYDENFGGPYGNCHLALGSSYSDTYDGDPSRLTKDKKRKLGLNDSALHWDLVNTENKTVTAHLKTGEHRVIYEKGKFAY